MTGVRLSLRAFRNVHFYAGYFQSWGSLPAASAGCVTCWTYRRHLSHCLHRSPPAARSPHAGAGGFVTTSLVDPFLYAVRHKSKKSQKRNQTYSSQDEEEEEEVDLEDVNDYDDEPVEDASVPKDYKDVEKCVQSFRFDVVLTAGLGMSRNKIEEAFYDGKLRLNGEKLWKKSRAVKVGDILDLIVEENRDAGTVTVMRTILKDVLKDKTSTDKFKVQLRRWKKLTVPKVFEAPKSAVGPTTESEN